MTLELDAYQRIVAKGGLDMPDLLIVGTDANCHGFASARRAIAQKLRPEFKQRTVIACPDPHVERWYLADPESFHDVVGVRPRLGKKKCARGVYKDRLASAVVAAGHPVTLGGIEFASDIVKGMDLYRAGRGESSLKHFVDELSAQLRSLSRE